MSWVHQKAPNCVHRFKKVVKFWPLSIFWKLRLPGRQILLRHKLSPGKHSFLMFHKLFCFVRVLFMPSYLFWVGFFLNLSMEASRTLSSAGPGLVRAGAVRHRYPKFTQNREHQVEEFKGKVPEAKKTQHAALKTHKWNTDGMKRNKSLF